MGPGRLRPLRPEDEEDMPSANTWFIDELPPPLKKKKIVEDKANVLSGPPIKKVMETSPLLRHLTGLRDIGIDTAFRVDPKDLPARTPRLLEGDRSAPLLFTIGRRSHTDLVQTFAVMTDDGKFNTNWPLQVSFPLFLRNITYVLGDVADSAGEENLQPGQPVRLRPVPS